MEAVHRRRNSCIWSVSFVWRCNACRRQASHVHPWVPPRRERSNFLFIQSDEELGSFQVDYSSSFNNCVICFRELRKNRTASKLHSDACRYELIVLDGKPILGKDNLMSMIFAHSATKQNLILLEKQTNRLLAYNPEGGITLTKKQFSAGCTARSDLKQSGIYFCAPEIITKFSDNVDAQSFNEQIGNILAQDETICEYIFADILPNNAFADTAK